MVFAWSSDGAFAMIVPWKVVGSSGDAVQIAAMLESFPRTSRLEWARTGNDSDAIAGGPERRTDPVRGDRLWGFAGAPAPLCRPHGHQRLCQRHRQRRRRS
jgi:hypothetical protein